jgi:hypothetical protein
VGEAGEARKESLRAAILAASGDLTAVGEVPSTTNIARHPGKDKANVSHELAELIQAGKVVKGPKDAQVVPTLPAGPPPHMAHKQCKRTTGRNKSAWR